MGKFAEKIRNDLSSLRAGLTAKAVITLLFGTILVIINIGSFVWAVVYAFNDFYFALIPLLLIGLFGLVASCFIIFFISLHNAITPQAQRRIKVESSAANYKNKYNKKKETAEQRKNRKKKIIGQIAVCVAFILTGLGFLSYFLIDKAKYSDYIEINAIIVSSDGVSKYEYVVDGTTYYASGKVESSGMASPGVGDIAIIKYNPTNPSQIYLESEKRFFLVFSVFLLFCGMVMVLAPAKLPGEFLVGFITLGITALTVVMSFVGMDYTSVIHYLSRNLWIYFVFIFTNVGIVMLFEGITSIFRSKKDKKSNKNYKRKHYTK